MPEAKRILAAVDGSIHSLNAVSYLARRCRATTAVSLIYILPKRPDEIFWLVGLGDEFTEAMKEKYDRLEQERRNSGKVFLEKAREVLLQSGFRATNVRMILRDRDFGTAGDIIAEARTGYDALVMGRRGLNKVDSLFLGSVSDKVVQGVQDISVWIVDGEVHSNKILVAVDGSENSQKAVDYAARFAAEGDVQLTLCHVIRGVESAFGATVFELNPEIELRLGQWWSEKNREMFSGYKECLTKAGLHPDRISTKCITRGFSRAGDLLRETREGDYGTIIMGRRGISKVREFLMGRVTTKVLNGAQGLAIWIVP